MTLPDGAVTFLLTDIEGSTRLWESRAAWMREALPLHDAILVEIVRKHDGQVFKGTGDGVLAAFADPVNAVAAALEIQQTLPDLPWPDGAALKVRIALHTGVAQRRDGDYFGQALNRTARLLSIGHGEQVLLSAATYELVRDILPAEAFLRDLEHHRLKDLLRPEHVFQLGHAALRADFPPLRSFDSLLHNLPVQLTSFVGRDDELVRVREALEGARLLTLVGAGGCGKTRLAVQVGAELVERFADGVFLVELAPVSDPERVAATVLSVLGVREEAGVAPLRTLASALERRSMLLILDNCEHLVAACAHVADTLLRQCAGLRVLATSREALGILGETVHQVVSLEVPAVPDPPVDDAEMASLGACDAVRLFVERAQAVVASFQLTHANAPAVARLCVRLDGIPLAIELAAARTKSLSVEQIAERLDDRFRLLTSGNRAALQRHQTLRALMDWSYDLLTPQERMLLARLSVFSGGWSLEAAEGICSGEGIGEGDVLDLLSHLVDKSLVQVEGGRYRMLETIRQYALEKSIAVDDFPRLRERHLEWFAQRVRSDFDVFYRYGQDQGVAGHTLDADNIRVAWETAWEVGAVESLLVLAGLARFMWFSEGRLTEGIERLERSLERARELPESVLRGLATTTRGVFAFVANDREGAVHWLEASLAMLRRQDDPQAVADALHCLGSCHELREDTSIPDPAARALLEEALAINEVSGNPLFAAACQAALGLMATHERRFDDAERVLKEAGRRFEALGNLWNQGCNADNLGTLGFLRGDLAEARAQYRTALSISSQMGNLREIGFQLIGLGCVAEASGNRDQAITLFAAAETHYRRYFSTIVSFDRRRMESALSRLRVDVPPDAFARLWNTGLALSTEEAVQVAREVARNS